MPWQVSKQKTRDSRVKTLLFPECIFFFYNILIVSLLLNTSTEYAYKHSLWTGWNFIENFSSFLLPNTFYIFFEFQTSQAHKTYTNWKCLELIMHSPTSYNHIYFKSFESYYERTDEKSETIQRFPPSQIGRFRHHIWQFMF